MRKAHELRRLFDLILVNDSDEDRAETFAVTCAEHDDPSDSKRLGIGE